MATDPAVLFYSADFLMGTEYLSDAECGQYIRLLCWQHRYGPISQAFIASHFPNGLFPLVANKFKVNPDGSIYNVRMEKEKTARHKFVKSRHDNLHGKDKPKPEAGNL
jgi:hypothetical protein